MASCPILGLIGRLSGGRLPGLACRTGGLTEMDCNVGGIDRLARIVLGIGIVAVGVATNSWLGIVGLALAGTGVGSRCLLYRPLGLSTCGAKGGSEKVGAQR